MEAGDELTVEELIELELHGLNCLIETVSSGDPDPLFVQLRDDLSLLLEQLRRGKMHPEYAEVQLDKIRELQAQWLRDHQIPPN